MSASASGMDRVSFFGGVAFILLGCLLGLDQLDLISLSVGWASAAICAAAGVVLVVAGLEPEERSERE